MAATIHPFPASAAASVALVEAERAVPTDSHMAAIQTIKELYRAARQGHLASVLALSLIGQSHANPEVARLADMALSDLHRPVAQVAACECGRSGEAS